MRVAARRWRPPSKRGRELQVWYRRAMNRDDNAMSAPAVTLRKLLAGGVHIEAAHVRRGLQFLVIIGAPLVVGAVRGESEVALAAVIVGMAFGFADSDGPLL